MNTVLELIFKYVFNAWKKGHKRARTLIKIAGLLAAIGFILFLVSEIIFSPGSIQSRIINSVAIAIVVITGALLMISAAYGETISEDELKSKLEEKEKRFRENPQVPQAAWDLARSKLESYLDKNLSQVRSIFTLSVAVMLVGFGIIIYGAMHAYEEDKIGASILVTLSGLIVNFIGASFLVIYKSVMEQAKDFVNVLERINAVGMSVQILETISDENKELKEKASADLAKQLLELYAKK